MPTIAEAGVKGYETSTWGGLLAPAGTPKDVIAKLNAAIVSTLDDPALRQRLIDLSQDIFPRDQLTPQALAAHQKAEIEKWLPIITAEPFAWNVSCQSGTEPAR